MRRGFTVKRGGALKRKSQGDPAGDAFGYVESVIDECTKVLPAVEAGNYDQAVTDLERASGFLQKGLTILKHIDDPNW